MHLNLKDFPGCVRLEPMRIVCRSSRAVTRVAIREARLSEIKRELLNSEKLSEHFQSNPHDAAVLHDEHLRPKAIKPQMGFLPDYLVPSALRGGSGKNKTSNSEKRRKRTKIKRKRESDPLRQLQCGTRKSQSTKPKQIVRQEMQVEVWLVEGNGRSSMRNT